ncbi:MAG: hypothetical protein Q8O07_06555, partial [Chloroflexota bacterium]|nr:hypothetical protein [Chloroflexota bacterium]
MSRKLTGRGFSLATDGCPGGSLAVDDQASRSEKGVPAAAPAAENVSARGQVAPVGGGRLLPQGVWGAPGGILRLSPRIVLALILSAYFVLGVIYGTA